MAGPSIDIERGVQKPSLAGTSTAAPALSILRRRKGLVIILALTISLLFYLNASTLEATTSSSFRWMKDSMKPIDAQSSPLANADSPLPPSSPPLPNSFGLDVAQAAAIEQAHALANDAMPGGGTDALRKFAADKGLSVDALNAAAIAPNAKPSHSEQVLVFLQALTNPTYEVPSTEREWRKQLLPESADGLRQTLSEVEFNGGTADIDLFKTSRSRWAMLHQSRHPLTVFSKSYCPFSKRAKALLNSMNATYTVYEVDLRPDAHSLQAALAAISGHHTFPTVFAGDKVLGGSDDLANLDRLKILPGLLKGAGAL